MPEPHARTLTDEIVAATEWWREAGVDVAFADEPQSWLTDIEKNAQRVAEQATAPKAEQDSAPEPQIEKVGGLCEDWPRTLAEFGAWWTEEQSLALAGGARRIQPRGTAKAGLMLLVAHPEADDTERLLQGSLGSLVSSMLSAMQINEDRVYLASILPSHTPHADIHGLQQAGWGEIALHHVTLARPERLIVFGANALPLIGHDPAQGPAEIREIAIQEKSVPMLAAWGLDRLHQRPKARKAFWQKWLEWTEDSAPQ